MIETLQGEGGVVPAQEDFYKCVRELCDERGALMIIDEEQTGMGRTGTLWGYEHFTHTEKRYEPDVCTSAKALGGGIPIAAMCCRNKCDVFLPGDHASTIGGNPLCCAAGLAVTS